MAKARPRRKSTLPPALRALAEGRIVGLANLIVGIGAGGDQAVEEAGLLGEMLLATFDLSPDVLAAVRDGNMLFAIDQQQYVQGYLPIVYLTLNLENLNTPGSLLVPTGPGFVTADTAARVIELSAAGTR